MVFGTSKNKIIKKFVVLLLHVTFIHITSRKRAWQFYWTKSCSKVLSHTEKTELPMGCTWAMEWVAHGNFAMKIRLPTTSIYENSGQLSRQQLLPNMKKVGSSVGSRVGCPWAARGNFAMQIRLPTTSIYGYSGQPTTFQYGNSGQFSGQPTELPTIKKGSHLWFTRKTFVAHVYIYILHVFVNDLKSVITKQAE